MPFKSYKEFSKEEWGLTDINPSIEHLQIGCLQRIATASELMAKNFIALQNELEHYKTRYKRISEQYDRIERSNRALRGHLKKAKSALSSNQN